MKILDALNFLAQEVGQFARCTMHTHWKREMPSFRLKHALIIIAGL